MIKWDGSERAKKLINACYNITEIEGELWRSRVHEGKDPEKIKLGSKVNVKYIGKGKYATEVII